MSFTNCKIFEKGTDIGDYLVQKTENRGQPKYLMSSSSLREFSRCPSRWVNGYVSPDSDAMDYGNLLDTLALTPDRFDHRYVVRPETYSKTVMECPVCGSQSDSQSCKKCKCERVKKIVDKPWNGNETSCAEWLENQIKLGKTISTKEEVMEAQAAVARLQADEILNSFIEASDKQVWVVGSWIDEDTGIVVPVQCLIDLVPRKDTEFAKCLGDLKTTRNAGLRAWQSWCAQAGYHVQAAFNLDLYMSAVNPDRSEDGEDRNTFCFVVQENYPPFQTARRMMSDLQGVSTMIGLGRTFCTSALARYARCIKTGNWPSYDDNKGAVQGWSPVDPLPWMEFEAMSGVLEAEQERQLESANDDVPN